MWRPTRCSPRLIPACAAALSSSWRTIPACTPPRTSRTAAITPAARTVPMLEPADSRRVPRFTSMRAFELSEKYDTPVMLRLCHPHCALPEPCGRRRAQEIPLQGPTRRTSTKYVMMPGIRQAPSRRGGRARRSSGRGCRDRSASTAWKSATIQIGIIARGICLPVCQGSAAATGQRSQARHGLSPARKADPRFCHEASDSLIVVEELDAIIRDALQGYWASPCQRQGPIPACRASIRAAMVAAAPRRARRIACPAEAQDVPMRPPVLCPGCPHRGVFYVLKKLGRDTSAAISAATRWARCRRSGAMDTCDLHGRVHFRPARAMNKARGA